MATLKRRDFLKAMGLTGGTTALSACGTGWTGIDDNLYLTPIEAVLPYVVRPDQVTPGAPTFFATTVESGPHAAPVAARHREGRVINVGKSHGRGIEDHFPAAVPKGALFALQRHYSPDRFQGPIDGGTAGKPFADEGGVSKWTAAVQALAAKVKAARDGGKKVVYLGGYRSGTLVRLIREVCDDAIFWEPHGYDCEATAAELVWGKRFLPEYDLAEARYVLSFGAPFLSGWGGTRLEAGYGAARDPNQGGFVARFALVSAHRDQTGANADDWYPARPGSEAMVALAVAKLVAEKRPNADANARRLAAVGDPAAAAAASGLTVEQITTLAEQLLHAGTSVVLPGGTPGGSVQGTQLAVATTLLNVLAGNLGSTVQLSGYTGPIDPWSRVAGLIREMAAGQIGVLLVDEVNPVYSLPEDAGFNAALPKVVSLVSLTGHPDETAAVANLVLPCADTFEDWGDEEPIAGVHLLRQPAMTSLYGAPSLGDVLLKVRSAVTGTAERSWRDTLMQRWESELYAERLLSDISFQPVLNEELPAIEKPAPGVADTPEPAPAAWAGPSKAFLAWWNERLMDGYYASPLGAEGFGGLAVTSGSLDLPTNADTHTGTGDWFLVPALHAHLYDGRWANQPWAQELPDPMTGQVWDTWVLVHPDTASALGVQDNDLVAVETDHGSIELGIEMTPFVRKDTIVIPVGNGHTANGRYADSTGKNVARLLKAVTGNHGELAWQHAKARLKALGRRADLVSTFGHDDDENRNLAVLVNADALAKQGDAAGHGDLTGIHGLEIDERLTSRGLVDFYGLTDHPVYRFGMKVDTNACSGCGACSLACYAENNLPVVGKNKIKQGREMGWLRINRYQQKANDKVDEHGAPAGTDAVVFVPMMCQHCGHAPCESVCPVLATYHTLEGLNAMIYNRCAGTRYCSNACPYGARRFNYHSYVWPEPLNLQLNPDVMARTMGVMEKCTFCVQRIRAVKSAYRDLGFNERIPDAALQQLPACAEACPSGALVFGNLQDPESTATKARSSGRYYEQLAELNVFPAMSFLGKASFYQQVPHHGGHGATPPDAAHEGEHGAAGEHGGESHGEAHGTEGH